jgi:hypothetical protein
MKIARIQRYGQIISYSLAGLLWLFLTYCSIQLINSRKTKDTDKYPLISLQNYSKPENLLQRGIL